MTDYSYLGSGRLYLKEIGGAAGLVEIGNCSAVSFGVTEETKELKDYTEAGGGTYNEVRRISAVETSITMHDINPANLARALYGAASTEASATVTDESQPVVAQGDFIPTDFIATSITSVKVLAVTMVEDTDYEVRPGGVYIIPGGSIIAADDVLITYAKADSDVVQALTDSSKEYELLFSGLNEARSGKSVVVRAYRVKMGAAQNLSLIGEDYASLEVTGKLLKDTTKIGAGISQYFKVDIEA